MTRLIVTLVATALFTAPVTAAPPKLVTPATVTALEACRKVTNDSERLACYDRAVPALTDAVSSGDVAVVDREQMVRTRRSLFGFTLPDLPLLGGGRKGEPELKKIASTIVTASAIADGRYRMKIADSDAIWETTENSDSLSPPRSGQKVTIEKGALGAYFIQVGSQRWVRGRRVR